MTIHADTTASPRTAELDRPRRVVVVGGVAGGMSAATRLRRLDESAEIVVVERSGHVSYANCGLPYYVGGVIEDEDDLLLQTPERLFERFRLDVRVGSEVVGIDPGAHTVTVRSAADQLEYDLRFDTLVLSPGAVPVRPPIPGFERVRVLRTVEDAEHLFDAVSARPASAVVIGAGFIGLETAENLSHAGIPVSVVEAADQVLTPLDAEMAVLVQAELRAPRRRRRDRCRGHRDHRRRASVWPTAESCPASSSSARSACVPTRVWPSWPGSTSGLGGGIAVDDAGRTSRPDIYAVGRRGREGGLDRRWSVARRPRQRGEPAGSEGRRPHRRTRAPSVALARHRHRQGVHPDRGDDRAGTRSASVRPAVPIGSCGHTR